ncbi:MAG: DNA polymerase III subunit delta' [Candidatus Nanopelagicales bacterium]|nr:DNA polymerase III subunit delta' [Candidatus Nanopelagicales bacterium]
MSVWHSLIGQPSALTQLRAAAASAHGSGDPRAMTHAWLITGPPGSGRSIAAVSFAAALVCESQGCGDCPACRAVLNGSHADVDLVRSTTLSHGKDRARQLVARASGAPSMSAWRCFVILDADRMTPAAASTLLKAIEEPTPRAVWVLCAPSPEDLLPTIRSRTRHVALKIPSAADIAEALVSEGVDPATAAFAASASQGHIGRARALAVDEHTRERRMTVLRIPNQLGGLDSAYAAAHELRRIADDDARARNKELDEREAGDLLDSYGQGATGVSAVRVKALARSAMTELNKNQQQRSSRSTRDELDRHFVDLTGLYRDVLVMQLGAGSDLINADLLPLIEKLSSSGDAALTILRIDAISRARSQLAGNVPPALVCEALMVNLLHPVRS